MKTGYRMPYPIGPYWYVLAIMIACMATYISTEFLDDHQSAKEPTTESPNAIRPSPRPNKPEQAPGSAILKHYGSDAQSPQQDITDLSHVFGNFSLLVKGDQPIPLSANEEIANALRGKNKIQLQFLPGDAPCFNTQGQIVDRWQTPLFFHAQDKDRIDIRSAGPDKQMWTADDIHRHFDGQFVRGAALNAPSLLEATKDYRGPK